SGETRKESSEFFYARSAGRDVGRSPILSASACLPLIPRQQACLARKQPFRTLVPCMDAASRRRAEIHTTHRRHAGRTQSTSVARVASIRHTRDNPYGWQGA